MTVISKSVLHIKVCYKGTVLYIILTSSSLISEWTSSVSNATGD